MPIHVAITRRVRPGCETEFQQALREFFQASLAHGGVLGATMIVPPPGSDSREFGILRTFADEQERDDCLSREEALRLYTQGSSWFSSESGKKGAIAAGQLADFIALSDDYFSVPEEQIKSIKSVLTVMDGKVVHATDEFTSLAPPALPVLPEWSPVKVFGGYGAPLDIRKAARAGVPMAQHQHNADCHGHGCSQAAHQLLAGVNAARHRYAEFFGLGCDCFAF